MASKPTYISIDVECVATGRGHNDRAPASVALVGFDGKVILDLKIHQVDRPLDYLTPYSGLTDADFGEALPLAEVVLQVKQALLQKPNTVLVGQSIENDITWLGLVEGTDFASSRDLAETFKSADNHMYSLDFASKSLLSKTKRGKSRTSVGDAQNSMKLFRTFALDPAKLSKAKDKLATSWQSGRPGPRPAQYKGICMMKYNSRKCVCHQPSGNAQPVLAVIPVDLPSITVAPSAASIPVAAPAAATAVASTTTPANPQRGWTSEDDLYTYHGNYISEAISQGRCFDPRQNYYDDYDNIYGDFWGNSGGHD